RYVIGCGKRFSYLTRRRCHVRTLGQVPTLDEVGPILLLSRILLSGVIVFRIKGNEGAAVRCGYRGRCEPFQIMTNVEIRRDRRCGAAETTERAGLRIFGNK